MPRKSDSSSFLVVRVSYPCLQTDLHAAKGDWPLESKDNLCGGHEGAGYVVAIGEHSNTDLKIGDPVGIKWYVQFRELKWDKHVDRLLFQACRCMHAL